MNDPLGELKGCGCAMGLALIVGTIFMALCNMPSGGAGLMVMVIILAVINALFGDSRKS
jgi:hypothetical protein